MDSYTTNPTSHSDEQDDHVHGEHGKYQDLVGEEVSTPGSYCGDGGATEREWGNPFDQLKSINTDIKSPPAGGVDKNSADDREGGVEDNGRGREDARGTKAEDDPGQVVIVESPTSDGDGEDTPVAPYREDKMSKKNPA